MTRTGYAHPGDRVQKYCAPKLDRGASHSLQPVNAPALIANAGHEKEVTILTPHNFFFQAQQNDYGRILLKAEPTD